MISIPDKNRVYNGRRMDTQTQTIDAFVREAVAPQARPLAMLQEEPNVKTDEKYGYSRLQVLSMLQETYDRSMSSLRPSFAAAVTAVTRIAQICEFIGKDEGDLPRDCTIQIIQFAGAPPVAKQIQSQVTA